MMQIFIFLPYFHIIIRVVFSLSLSLSLSLYFIFIIIYSYDSNAVKIYHILTLL
jgi:hypothetical protein